MNKNLSESVKSLCGIEIGSEIEFIFEGLSDSAPFIGRVITSYKIYKLRKYLERLENEIDIIKEKVKHIHEPQFKDLLTNFLFPKVLQNLMEEDEENKIAYFLKGFEFVIDNEIYDKAKILMYYDVLSELRFIEIQYLISISSLYKMYLLDAEYNGKQIKNKITKKQFGELKPTIENKLERLGLVNTGRLLTYNQIMKILNESIKLYERGISSTNTNDEIHLTKFGNDFLGFFRLLDNYVQNEKEG